MESNRGKSPKLTPFETMAVNIQGYPCPLKKKKKKKTCLLKENNDRVDQNAPKVSMANIVTLFKT